jgi:hypothetical protein
MLQITAAAFDVSGRHEGAPLVSCATGNGAAAEENRTVSKAQNKSDANQQVAAIIAPASDAKVGGGERWGASAALTAR